MQCQTRLFRQALEHMEPLAQLPGSCRSVMFFLSSAARLVPKFPGALRQDAPAARLGPSTRTSQRRGEY